MADRLLGRRAFHRLALTLLAGGGPGLAARGAEAADDANALAARCRIAERTLGGRLGVHCIDAGDGRTIGWRADERFPMCSTFKWLAASAVLARVDRGQERLDRRVRYRTTDLIDGSPVTRDHADGDGLSVADLCDAAITRSDNTAANLLLDTIGGLAGWNRHVRALGDTRSRLDRPEPFLNEGRAGDPRDTTTPAAMTGDLRRLLLEDVLSPASRARLVAWMLDTKTSDHRLRADLPAGWRLADKTGTGIASSGAAGDVGVLWPPSGAPLVIAVYVARATAPRDGQEAAIADVGRWIRASAVSRRGQ